MKRSPSAAACDGTVGLHRVPLSAEVILLALRWYLRYGMSCRDLEELLAQRGVEVGLRQPRPA